MADRNTVATFLRQLKVALQFGEVRLQARQRAALAIVELNLTVAQVTTLLGQLEITDYSEGPLPDHAHENREVWVFGLRQGGDEIYIKVRLVERPPSLPTVLVWSFHRAERPMKYPLRAPRSAERG